MTVCDGRPGLYSCNSLPNSAVVVLRSPRHKWTAAHAHVEINTSLMHVADRSSRAFDALCHTGRLHRQRSLRQHAHRLMVVASERAQLRLLPTLLAAAVHFIADVWQVLLVWHSGMMLLVVVAELLV